MYLKGKKGLFYVGQPHHMRLWKPVFEKLTRKGMEIIYVTSTVYFPFELTALNEKIVPVYLEDLAGEKDLKMAEDYYALLGKKLSELHVNNKVFNLLPPEIVSQTLKEVLREFILFEKLLQKEQPDVIFALHEVNRWGKILGYLSFKMGIPFVTLQEGAYYGYGFSLSYHTEYSLTNFVWGPQTVDVLRKVGNAPEKAWIVGDTHLDYAVPNYLRRSGYHRKRVYEELKLDKNKPLLMIIQGVGSYDLRERLKELKSLLKDYNVVVKLHPNLSRQSVDELKGKLEAENFRLLQLYDSYSLLAAADVCVAFGKSTLVFEAFAFDKPVVEVDYSKGKELFFAQWDISFVSTLKALKETVEKILVNGISEEKKKKIEEWKNYVFFSIDGKATERVVNGISFILKERAFYRKWKPERVRFKVPQKKRLSVNVVVFGNVNLLSLTLQKYIDLLNVQEDEVNLIFPEPLEELYTEFKEQLKGKGFINLHLARGVKVNLSALFNYSFEVGRGSWFLFHKEGLIPFSLPELEGLKQPESFFGGYIIEKDGILRHAGIAFEHNNVVYRLYEGIPIQKIPVKERKTRALDYVLLGSRQALEDVGVFDERLHDYYSLIDFSLFGFYSGKDVKILPKVVFGLIEDKSFSPLTAEEHARFYTKWRGKTEYNLMKYTQEDGVDIYELYLTSRENLRC